MDYVAGAGEEEEEEGRGSGPLCPLMAVPAGYLHPYLPSTSVKYHTWTGFSPSPPQVKIDNGFNYAN